MPRGVPANGRRQPRAVTAVSEEIDEAFSEAAEGVTGGELRSADEEAAQLPEPAVRLTEDLSGKSDEELTPEQQEIKFLRDRLAQSEGKKEYEPEVEEIATPGAEENILIHFLEDGLTVNGRVMYRGDELEFDPRSKAYKDTFDRRGRTFLDLRHNEFAQVDRWGKIMFRNGPWPGKTYADGSYEALKAERGDGSLRPPTAEEIERAEKLRKRRAAPHLPSTV